MRANLGPQGAQILAHQRPQHYRRHCQIEESARCRRETVRGECRRRPDWIAFRELGDQARHGLDLAFARHAADLGRKIWKPARFGDRDPNQSIRFRCEDRGQNRRG